MMVGGRGTFVNKSPPSPHTPHPFKKLSFPSALHRAYPEQKIL